MIVAISSGESTCTILPHAGGSIGSWNVAGQNMFRPATSPHDPLQSASFPLLPFSNRIGNAHFNWQGKKIQLQPHKSAMPHAIHGVGWERKWEIDNASDSTASLRLTHKGDAIWPWAFEAEQHFSVGPDTLNIQLSARNMAVQPVPLAFGHHPYFESAGATLRFEAQHFFPADDTALPLAREMISAETDFSKALAVSKSEYDNVFGAWSGSARIEWSGRPLALSIESNLPDIVLYTPKNAEFFCFEPVPHINNALNRHDCQVPIIEPGESFAAQIRFTASPA